jgi:ParB family transcriptional regulator, chromosome partitioning protein
MTTPTQAELCIPVENIHPNPDNPRTEAGDVSDLAASIKALGLLQPILVSPMPDRPDHYLLQDGWRRWTAARYVQSTVRAFLYHPTSDRSGVAQTVIIGLVTSLHGKTLSHMERAHGYGRLREQKMTMKQIAQTVGTSDTEVSNHLALLQLDLATQRRVENGTVSMPRALQAVREVRAKDRAKKGHGKVAPVWEPDHFSIQHFLARKANNLCNAREHSLRRRFGGACGQCWETVIREDQMKVDAARASGPEGLIFKSPEQDLFALGRQENGKG